MATTEPDIATQLSVRRRRWRVGLGIGLLLALQFMLVLDGTVINVALPRINEDLQFGPASLSWVINGYTLAFAGLLLLGGRIGDLIGRRRAFTLGVLTFTIASLLGGLALTPAWLVAARIAQGAGAALAAPNVLALLTSGVDTTVRNRRLALFSIVASVGSSLGLVLGGILTDIGSWRWTLLINVPVGLVVAAGVGRLVPETDRHPATLDAVGAVTATLGSVTLVWAVINAPTNGWLSLPTLATIALGAVLLLVLARTELRVPHPLIPPALVTDRRRVLALAAMALAMGGQFSVFLLMSLYDENQLSYTATQTGLSFLPMSLAFLLVSSFTPRLVARVGAPPLIAAGTLLLAGSFLMFSHLGEHADYLPHVLLAWILNGAAVGLIIMPGTSVAMDRVRPEHMGSASGFLQTIQGLGSAIGVAIVISVYAARSTPGPFVTAAHAALITAGVLALAGFAAAVALLREASHETAPHEPA